MWKERLSILRSIQASSGEGQTSATRENLVFRKTRVEEAETPREPTTEDKREKQTAGKQSHLPEARFNCLALLTS